MSDTETPLRPATPQSRRAEATRERILRAAAEAFDQRGYLGVNLNDVVRELGLTKGALYYFFPTKEALAAEIVRRHFGVWEPLATDVLAKHSNLIDALIEISMVVAAMYQTDCYARAGARLSAERNLINADLPEPFQGWIARVTTLLEMGKQRGQVRSSVDALAAAETMVSFFYGAQLVSSYFTGRQDLLDRMRSFWSLVEPSLRPPPEQID
ncbi:MAG TPA: ScbR family autoregulator-binding transcription factor [Actinomycetota bacterium]|nr:ScbR family autoregulator-binding transcription factor [Actinomycetota bacterium]